MKISLSLVLLLMFVFDQNGKILTIHGKDIWVRNEPTTGKVVMKLNEGDRCTIRSTGHYEIIHNSGDFWYSIEFKGQNGWVFGSQTDKKLNSVRLSGTSAEVLWESFKAHKIEECKKMNTGDKTEEMECIVDRGQFDNILNKDEDKLQLMHSHMNPVYYEYRKGKSGPKTMVFIDEMESLEGASGWATSDHFYAGFKDVDQYNLSLPGRFDGAIDTIIQINPTELVVFAIQQTRGVAYYTEKYFNIYRIDLTGKSMQMVNAKVGKAESGFSLVGDTEEGGLRVKASKYKYVATPVPSFKLFEYKMKKKGENFEDISTPTTTTFTWDKTQKKFVKQ